MVSKIVRCDNCGHPVAIRLRENGAAVLPFDGFECTECGGESYSLLDEAREREPAD